MLMTSMFGLKWWPARWVERMRPGAVPVYSANGYRLFTGGLGVPYGAVRLGATVVPASSGATDRQLRPNLDLRSDVLCWHAVVCDLPG